MRLPASLWWLLFFVPLLERICCEDVFGILGENFTFPVKTDKKIMEIIWTKNKDKVAEWEGQNETTYFTSLQNRGLLNKETGCLTIFNLENSDAGTYVLDYFDFLRKNYVLTFSLDVLLPPPEPEISCNISGDDLMLKCTADFLKPLDYTWKFSSISIPHRTQEVCIPKKNVGPSEKAECIIKFSQTEKGSEISLAQCFPDNKGDGHHKRSRVGLILAFVLSVLVAAIVGAFLYWRGRTNAAPGGDALNSPVHGSATFPQNVDYKNENPEADKALDKEDSAPKDEQTVNNDANQEDTSEENSSLLPKCADDHGTSEGDKALDKEDSAPKDEQTVNNDVNQEDTSEENSSLLPKCADDHGTSEGDVKS